MKQNKPLSPKLRHGAAIAFTGNSPLPFLCVFARLWPKTKTRIFAIGLVALLFGGMPDIAFSQTVTLPEDKSEPYVTIKGQVRVPSGMVIPPEGLDVVLLKFILNPEGQVTPAGPQGRIKTNASGQFEFAPLLPDFRAGYQLGTRVEGDLYSSKPFFMKAGKILVEMDIIIPGISTDSGKLETTQISLVVESGMGEVVVTEVLNLDNPTPDRIDSNAKPFVQHLPQGYAAFLMLDAKSGSAMQHQIEGNLLKIQYIFPAGKTQIIYQYRLPALFGGLEISKKFSHSLEKVGVFTPVGRLQVESEQLIFADERSSQDTKFLAWNGQASDSNRLIFKVKNVPTSLLQYAGVSGVLLILLFGTVGLFFRFRFK